MAEPIRKFDISWLPKVLPKRDAGTASAGRDSYAAGRDIVVHGSARKPKASEALLQALRAHEGQAYVVELAKDTNLDFQTTLSAILELTAAGDVRIVERDRNAADHLVALSDG